MLSFLLMLGVFQPNQSVQAEESVKINAGASMLIDADTGQILYGNNEDELLGVASMTKMMTEYLLLEAIKKNKISWDQEYEVSEYVYKVSQDRSLSNVPLRIGEKYNIRELYEAMTIYSANAATIAIAETIAGSEKEFVKLMNKKAKDLGLAKYKFVNSSGLNNRDLKGMHPQVGGAEDENMMSARDTAKLAYHLLKDYPEVLETTTIPKKKFREGTDDEINMENWNWMLPSLVFGYEGMTGLKTGTTDFAGYCFTGTAERDGRTLIAVVMNATDDSGKGSYNARFVETKKLLDYGFQQFEQKELFPAGYQVKGKETVDVSKGKEKQVAIESKEPFVISTKKNQNTNYKPKLTLKSSEFNDEKQLEAPFKKGKVVGYLSAEAKDGQSIEYVTGKGKTNANVAMVTAEQVDKANWFVLSMRAVGGFFAGIWSGIAETVTGWF
nr:D-alanyl-D-alanine carboxypeptidase family protein [Bacillus ectoiniformans]